MISIIASPKPWTGVAQQHQENAVKSWLALHPDIEVILYGDACGTTEACKRLGIQHIPDIAATPHGVPYFGAIANHAAKHARYDLQCYVNCDILFTKSLLDATQYIPFSQFVIIGQRIDLVEGAVVDVTKPDILDKLRDLSENGMATLHPPAGSDYFIFPRGMWAGLPKIVIGRGGYDGALIAFCLSREVPVLDATLKILAIHQFHGYEHVCGGQKEVFNSPDAKENRVLFCGYNGLALKDATWIMTRTRVEKNLSRGDYLRAWQVKYHFVHKNYRIAAFIGLLRKIFTRIRLSNGYEIKIQDVLSSKE